MALLSGNSRKWTFIKSVHFRIFILAFTAIVFVSIALSAAVSARWREKLVLERQAEADRIAKVMAGEIVSAGGVQGDEISRCLTPGYLRTIVLDENAIVLQDSAMLSEGICLAGEEVLRALSGETACSLTKSVYMTAIPVASQENTTVDGAVLVIAELDSVDDTMKSGREILRVWSVLLCLSVGAFLWVITGKQLKPMKQIIYWLQHFAQPEVRKYGRPKLKTEDEYYQIVEAVDASTKDLMNLDQSRREFVSNVSHELKTPLSSIKVLTESILLQEGVPEEVYREFLQDINSEVDRMNNIINDLLTLVRLDEGEGALNLTQFSLKDMLEVIVKRVEPLCRQHEIHLNMEECEEVYVEADETKLTLAASNLIQNAIKYNKDMGSVHIRCWKEDGKAMLSVSDTGIGIEQEHYDKLFERFYRVDKARDRATGGSGLGLSIVKKIVSLHKGDISVESVPGEGSVFTIILPVEHTLEAEGDV